jgi:hypothetical protein
MVVPDLELPSKQYHVDGLPRRSFETVRHDVCDVEGEVRPRALGESS